MREDQDAERAGRLDEARRGDRLARRGRVAEAVAADGARVVLLRLLGKLRFLDLDDERRVLVLVLDLLLLELLRRRRVAVAVPVAVRLVVALARGDELGEHPGERVDLVAAERGAGGGARLRLGEHALEAEQEAVADLPLRGRRGQAGVHLGDCVVERAAAGCALGRATRPGPRPRGGTARPPTLPRGVAEATTGSAASGGPVGCGIASCICAARFGAAIPSRDTRSALNFPWASGAASKHTLLAGIVNVRARAPTCPCRRRWQTGSTARPRRRARRPAPPRRGRAGPARRRPRGSRLRR